MAEGGLSPLAVLFIFLEGGGGGYRLKPKSARVDWGLTPPVPCTLLFWPRCFKLRGSIRNPAQKKQRAAQHVFFVQSSDARLSGIGI